MVMPWGEARCEVRLIHSVKGELSLHAWIHLTTLHVLHQDEGSIYAETGSALLRMNYLLGRNQALLSMLRPCSDPVVSSRAVIRGLLVVLFVMLVSSTVARLVIAYCRGRPTIGCRVI